MTRPQASTLERQRGSRGGGPFTLMRRFSEDMDRLFESFFGRGVGDWPGGALAWPESTLGTTFLPAIEVSHQGNKLIVQADIPGLKKEDVKVEVRDGELSISGERQSREERNERGFYRSERSYGSFHRTVPLPEGAKPDTASATFENGVLRVEIEAPAQGSQARQIEIREGGSR